jgi:alkylresorcinol/alkylpyrone synthase
LHAATSVEHRHLALPIEAYRRLDGFGAANDAFITVGTELGERAVRDALTQVGLQPGDVDLLMVTSVTGIAAPSLDARLVPLLGLRPDVKRLPVFGLGCVAGAAGIARLHDLVAGDPDAVAVLLAVELCSLTVQRDDTSMANLVGSGLFGDGAAAVVLVGERRAAELGLAGPQVRATRSRFYPGTERVMGWDVGGSGFRIVLAASVADVVEEHLGHDVTSFLGDHDLKTDDVATWVAHPGGPKVLHAMARTLGLPPGALDRTWRSLARVGNLSSASVLHVLADTLAEPTPSPGRHGVLLAMGPGFCSELVLLRW